jgi:hypothetical protein
VRKYQEMNLINIGKFIRLINMKLKSLIKQRISFVGNFRIEKMKLFAYFAFCLSILIIVINYYRIAPMITKSINSLNKELIFASNQDKLSKKIGPKVIDFYEFIKRNTPEDAVILIPPQALPWPMIGNAAYSRYFLYPRHLISGLEVTPGIDLKEKQVQYVIVAWGEVNTYQYGYTHGWPKFFVPAKRIIYKKNLEEIKNYESVIYYKDFDPIDIDPKLGGLIEVDRERL